MHARTFLLPCTALVLALYACATGGDLSDDDDTALDGGGDATQPNEAATSSSSSSSGGSGSSSGGSSSGGSSSGGSSSGEPPECGALVINEVSGGSSDWVEIYNPADCSVDLGDYSLVYRSENGQSDLKLLDEGSSDTLSGTSYYVVGTGGDAPFATGTSLSASNGQLALKKGTAKVDEVGYGTANGTYGEGSNAGSPGTDGSIARVPNGVDTGDNSNDFQVVSSPTKGAAND